MAWIADDLTSETPQHVLRPSARQSKLKAKKGDSAETQQNFIGVDTRKLEHFSFFVCVILFG